MEDTVNNGDSVRNDSKKSNKSPVTEPVIRRPFGGLPEETENDKDDE